MLLTYAAYIVTFWLVFATAAAVQLPTHRNPAGAAVMYFILGPSVIVCFSAELLIHVKEGDLQAVSEAWATKRMSWSSPVAVGALCALSASSSSVIIWKTTEATWNSWGGYAFTLASMGLLVYLAPGIGLMYLIRRAKRLRNDA